MPPETNQAHDSKYKKKQILVVVLLAGLMIAILTQPSNDEQPANDVEISLANLPAPAMANVEAAENVEPATAASESIENRSNRLAEIRELSRIDLSDIEKLELLAPEPERINEKTPGNLPTVQAIYGTSSGHAALVGESIVRGGQKLPEGGKVLDVTTGGIQIAR